MSEIKLASSIDESVNFITPISEKQFLEARYVRRSPEEIICYLSTQRGCIQGCRMCHLTQMGHTESTNASFDEIINQAREVLEHYEKYSHGALSINYNFMARGEPLDSYHVVHSGRLLLNELANLAIKHNLLPRFKISTIIPKRYDYELIDTFPVIYPDIYYSVYSADEKIRRRWLPNAKPLNQSVDLLKRWQDFTHKIVRIHYAVIKDVNDDFFTALGLSQALKGLMYDVNLVYYNPYNDSFGKEGKIEEVAQHWKSIGIKTSIVNRVGFDVKASCGMFYNASSI